MVDGVISLPRQSPTGEKRSDDGKGRQVDGACFHIYPHPRNPQNTVDLSAIKYRTSNRDRCNVHHFPPTATRPVKDGSTSVFLVVLESEGGSFVGRSMFRCFGFRFVFWMKYSIYMDRQVFCSEVEVLVLVLVGQHQNSPIASLLSSSTPTVFADRSIPFGA